MSTSTRAKQSKIMSRVVRSVTSTHVALYRLTGGALLGGTKKRPTLLLTTTGRKSGKAHTTPLFCVVDEGRYVVIASNGGIGALPNWWLNLRAGGPAQVEIGRTRVQVSAQQAEGEERARLWSRMVAVFPNYETYQTRTPYTIPVVILNAVAGS